MKVYWLADNGSQAYMGRMMASRRRLRRDGTALRGHINSAHRGVVDSACPACQELQREMAAPSQKEVTA